MGLVAQGNLAQNIPVLLTNYELGDSAIVMKPGLPVWKAVRATSAAPFYFDEIVIGIYCMSPRCLFCC